MVVEMAAPGQHPRPAAEWCQGSAEGAVAEKGPSSAPVGLRETVVAPLTAAHVISYRRRCSFATHLSLWFVAFRTTTKFTRMIHEAENNYQRCV